MKSETREGMKVDWDVPIEMDDGVVLRCDVFRPVENGRYPVILSYGPYAKGLSMQEAYKSQWTRIVKAAPDVLEGSHQPAGPPAGNIRRQEYAALRRLVRPLRAASCHS